MLGRLEALSYLRLLNLAAMATLDSTEWQTPLALTRRDSE